jgi:hypothetical protein
MQGTECVLISQSFFRISLFLQLGPTLHFVRPPIPKKSALAFLFEVHP